MIIYTCLGIGVASLFFSFVWIEKSQRYLAAEQLRRVNLDTADLAWDIENYEDKYLVIHVFILPRKQSENLYDAITPKLKSLENINPQFIGHLVYQDLSKNKFNDLISLVKNDNTALIKGTPTIGTFKAISSLNQKEILNLKISSFSQHMYASHYYYLRIINAVGLIFIFCIYWKNPKSQYKFDIALLLGLLSIILIYISLSFL